MDNKNGSPSNSSEKKESSPQRRRKQRIPASVRAAVWNTYIEGNTRKSKCFVGCGETISTFNFHAGHVLAEAAGGKVTLENLRPVCASCNTSMGTRHMAEYANTHGFTPLGALPQDNEIVVETVEILENDRIENDQTDKYLLDVIPRKRLRQLKKANLVKIAREEGLKTSGVRKMDIAARLERIKDGKCISKEYYIGGARPPHRSPSFFRKIYNNRGKIITVVALIIIIPLVIAVIV